MFKRILIVALGVVLGIVLSLAGSRLVLAWSFFPRRDLERSSGYVKEVLQIVNENYFDAKPVAYDALARSAIHGMVDTLDPHSEYLESKDNEALEEDLNGEFGGIGVEVEVRSDRFIVISPIAGSPSARAGMMRGDEIVSIDQKVLDRSSSMDQVVDLLHGKPHTHVKVGLFRPSARKHIDLDIEREVIKVESVKGARVIDSSVGYVQVTEFSEHTGEQFDDAVDQLLKKGITSLVIDLRDNPGGLLDAAVDVAEPFFRKGELIVYTQGRKPEDKEEFKAEAEGDPLTLPVAILINSGTASAAEIVTGALKDTHRAVIVGERSFGKGSVQSIFKLKDGEGLRLTTAHYYTPSGYTIHGHGITPQVEVVMTVGEDEKLRRQADRSDVADPADFKAQFGWEPIEDRQLEAALDVLRAVRLLDRTPASALSLSRLSRRPAASRVAKAR